MSPLLPPELFADQEREARQLIDTIRIKHSTVAHKELEQIVDSLLHLTSSELYDNSTHCILELLQNADDNHYNEGILPTLTFTYEPGGLRVDCNERGFQAKHVEAISTVRHSTKSGSKHSHGYTGEKGIGFKSIYRIADEVWISSRQYRFKFDKHEKFGMIAPVWADFPKPAVPDLTSFFLKLAESYDEQDLIGELKSFEPQLLLFLRRVRKVALKVQEESGAEWSQSIHKTTKIDRNNTITTLDTGSSQQRFVTFEHVVDKLPLEPRRLHITSSPLNFALPITTLPDEPLSGRQQVFALLPISDYGLQFLLNGDFILSASRSNIDESLPWNQRLRDGLADGFLAAVDHFNGGHLKYFWPFYVPNKEVSTFFSRTRDLILSRLRSESVLESTASAMAEPSSLVYVDPDRYADSSGRPFTLCPETERKYLSTAYPKWTIESIVALGVSEMSDADFLRDLKTMIDNNRALFEKHDKKWHQELSKALLPLTRDEELKEGLMCLPIISLCDGKWTSAQHKPVFFANDLDPAKFPGSIELSIVAAEVTQDYSRKTLLQALDIAEIDSARLCRHIADAHVSKAFRPETFSRAELISHAAYLFKSSWQPPDWVKVDLWFATSNGGRCKGSETYIQGDCEKDSAMARVFNKLRKKFSSIHDNYFLGPASGEVVRLADSIESPFATYSKVHLYSPWFGLIQDVTENYVMDQVSSLKSIGDVELVFDVDDDILAEDGRNNKTLLLTKSPTFHGDSKYTTPAARMLHSHYLSWGGPSGMYGALVQDSTSGKTGNPESNARESWRQYMIKTLHLSDIPRLVSRYDGTSKRKFELSDDFRFLFKECPVTDVLQLINEHWTTYAEWLELSAAQQRSEIAIASNKKLLAEIGGTKVMHKGASVLIRDLVLPDLDTFVNNLDIPVPVLEIQNHRDSTLRRRLSCFGIAVTNDLHYYLVCLQAVSNQAFPEHDILAYLYEQIQVRYMTDENAIYSAFDERPLIYAGRSDNKNSGPLWLTIGQATGRLRSVSRLYPDCKDLFTWLLSTSTDDLGALIRKATTIDASWPLHEIASTLIQISSSLSTMSPTKARVAVKPLGGYAMFPVSDGQRRMAYDHLVSTQNQTWFIADELVFEKSFRGVVTLLAFSGSEFRALKSLLCALNLDSRQLSKLCISKVFPSGMIRHSARDTRYFQSIATLFIRDLIPLDNPDRNKIGVQLVNAIVMVASEILERQIFRYKDGPEHTGHAVAGKIALRVESGGKDLRIFIARKDSIYQRRAFPLISMIAEHCGIKDSLSLRLLGAALSDSSIARVHSAFADAGYTGHDRKSVDYDSDIVTGQRHARSGDVFRISSVLSDSDYDSDSEEDLDRVRKSGSRSKYRSRKSRPRKNNRGSEPDTSDPRLPLLSFSKVGLEQPVNPIDAQGKFLVVQTMDPNSHLEYYGERLVSEMLKMELKDAYNPKVHWTSSLRARAGMSLFSDPEGSSPFTLGDLEASKAISLFLLKQGHDVAIYWSTAYPTFHVELAISSGDGSESFIWSTAQLRRIQTRRLRWNNHKAEKNVMILLKISHVYSKPTFEVFIDPWDLVITNRLIIHGNTKFRATINNFEAVDGLSLSRSGARMHNKPNQMPGITSTVGSLTETKSWSVAVTAFQHPYKYLRLSKNELRLFMLFPGKKSEPICGMIFSVSCTEDAGSLCIKDAGNYRALSYVWGDRKKEKLIYTESGTLKIWGSLHNAIMALREEKSAAILWIDAICINQNDDKEKIRQIRLLPQIFQQASRTLAFMGSDNCSNSAIETLLQIRAKLDKSETWPKGLKKVPSHWEHMSKPSPEDPIWQDIKQFFERTWFRRAWIVQEAVAAPTVTVVCGKWMVDWEDLHLAIEVVEQEPRLPEDITASWAPFSTLSSLRDWEARQRRFDLFTLLETFHYMDSTLKWDHFFALLGLAEDGDEEDFAPQYGGTEFATIACRYGRAFVKQGKGIHLLHRAGIAGRSAKGQIRFPSWLPDFTTRPRDRLLDLHDRGMVFNASEGIEEDISYVGADILLVRGCIVDEIIKVSKHSNGQGPKQWVKYFAEIDAIVDDVLGDETSEHNETLKIQVPIAGALSVGEFTIEESYAAFRQGLKKARFKSAKQLKLRDNKTPISSISRTVHGGVMTAQERGKQYESLLKKNIAGWKFVVTKRKHFGIAPSGVKVGNSIGIIGGGDVPFLLDGGPDDRAFRLVAGCYIHGIMNGEAQRSPGARSTYFSIY